MKKVYSVLFAAMLASTAAHTWAKDNGMMHHHSHEGFGHFDDMKHHKDSKKHRQNFTQSSTRTLANGETVQSHTVQKVSDNGFTRQNTLTNSKGQTATHKVDVVNDTAKGTHTRIETGTTFEGKNYSRQSSTQKTDNGYIRKSQFVSPEGLVGSKEVQAVVDKQAGTVTKNITVRTPEGETKQHSEVHQWHKKH